MLFSILLLAAILWVAYRLAPRERKGDAHVHGAGQIGLLVAGQSLVANYGPRDGRENRFAHYATAHSFGQLIGPAVAALIGEADVLLAVGTRFQAGDTRNGALALASRLIHIDADAGVIGRNYRPSITIVGDARLGHVKSGKSGGLRLEVGDLLRAETPDAGKTVCLAPPLQLFERQQLGGVDGDHQLAGSPKEKIDALREKSARAYLTAAGKTQDRGAREYYLTQAVDMNPDSAAAAEAIRKLAEMAKDENQGMRMSKQFLLAHPELLGPRGLGLKKSLFDGDPRNMEIADRGINLLSDNELLALITRVREIESSLRI